MGRITKALEIAEKISGTKSFDTAPSFPEEMPAVARGPLPAAPTDQTLVTLNDVDSPAAEEYRRLKSKIMAQLKKDESSNVLLVASALAGEGKSITAANLAISMAQGYNNTVILIDADLRKPTLAALLNVKHPKGLSDYLDGNAAVEEIIARTGVPKLTFVPGGRASANPVESLSSNRMRNLIGEMKYRYPDRYIIIDTAPSLPFAEAHALSAMVDRTLLVVRERVSSLQNVADAIASLNGSPLVGIVYNDSDAVDMNRVYGYYGRYGKYGAVRREINDKAGE